MSGSPRVVAALVESADIRDMVLHCLTPGCIADAERDGREKRQRRIAQKTLARVARTCRALKDPALDLLWRSVDDIVYLLSVLPSFVPMGRNPHEYTFRRTITPDEWLRFQEYASRVQELRVQGESSSIELSAWSVLSRRCAGGALLPRCERLLKFQIADVSSGFTEFMLLQSPVLRHLELDITKLSDASVEMTQMFIQECLPTIDRLETLSLSLPWNFNDEPERAMRFWEYSHLKSLIVESNLSITAPILTALKGFPSLRSLAMDVGAVELGDQPLDATFDQLRELVLVGVAEQVHRIVQATSTPYLETIKIRFTEVQQDTPRTTQVLQAVYETLAPSLREVHVTFESGYVPSEYIIYPDATRLLPPLRNQNLRALTYHFHNQFTHVLDHDLQEITNAWPELTALEFTYNREVVEYDPLSLSNSLTPTISTIIAFAAAHPHLERFALPHFNAKAVPPLGDISLRHSLSAFTIAYFQAGVPLCPAALVLDRLFPHLDMPEGAGEESEPDSRLQLLLLGMQTMRRSIIHDQWDQ